MCCVLEAMFFAQCRILTANFLELSEIKLKSPSSILEALWCNPSLNNSEAFGALVASEKLASTFQFGAISKDDPIIAEKLSNCNCGLVKT